jgi:KDO2-lipid IV(A) lauroyltransferase
MILNYDRDIEVATTALNKAVEQMINRFPLNICGGIKGLEVINKITTYDLK